ncbi:MAG: hypothetical protein Q4F31_09775 [Eubacteriales bacterium]|nr:hypothetical protein [Eubacteriales bacterium]
MKRDQFTVNILYTAVLAVCLTVWSLLDILAPALVIALPGPMVVIASVLAALTLSCLLCRAQKFHCIECLAFAALTSFLLPLTAGFPGKHTLFLACTGLIAYTVFSALFDDMKRRLDGPVSVITAGFVCYLACQCFMDLF